MNDMNATPATTPEPSQTTIEIAAALGVELKEARDDFGRTASERTVELSPLVAELVSREVELGDHATYDEALASLVKYGVSERARTREQKLKLQATKAKAAAMDELGKLLKLNPAIVTNPEQFSAALKKLGITDTK